MRQLAALSGIAVPPLRLYLQRGVVPRWSFMGSATRYQPRQLLYVLAVRRLRATERLTLAAIRTRLRALAPSELERFATDGITTGPIAEALGIQPVPSSPQPAVSGFPPSIDGAGLSSSVPRWRRLELALGLELHLRDDASPEILALAQRVHELCAAGEFVRGAIRIGTVVNRSAW